jgi:hypothetical protein
VAKLVNAPALEAGSLPEIAGSIPADRIAIEPLELYPMPKKKVAAKRGRPEKPLKIEGDWKDAVKHAIKRGKPPKKEK